jgi:hypothetical protein
MMISTRMEVKDWSLWYSTELTEMEENRREIPQLKQFDELTLPVLSK